jgi:hypothetical protein
MAAAFLPPAEQADSFLRIQSCALFASRMVLRGECVGLRM